MAEFKVVWSTRSLNDLNRVHDLLVEVSPQQASRMVESILDRVTQLEKFPESGPVEASLSHRNKAHRYLVEGHCKLIYRIEKSIVFVIRVFDTRQNPEKLQ